MKRDFVDFWSVNRWLCQYNIVIEEDCQWVNEAIIVHPLAETPYQSTDKFKYWHPDKLHQWLLRLDENTVKLCTFQQQWKSGRICPAFEYILFPCPDGSYYAGYPAENPAYYVRAFYFESSAYFYGTPKEREEKMQFWWLERGQWEISFAARRLWTCVLRSHSADD